MMADLVPENSPASGLIGRVKDILMKPKETWDVINGESDTIQSLYMKYVLPLAAIGPVASLLHSVLFGYSLFGITYKPSVTSAVSTAVISYLLSLVGVFLLSLIIDALAPTFGGTKNNLKAFQVAAYSYTAIWVAGIFGLLPVVGILTILGLYSGYLLYLGLPVLMKVEQDKAIGYIVVIVIAAIVVYMVLGALVAPLMSLAGAGGSTITLPGGS
jgi:Yip1 domain